MTPTFFTTFFTSMHVHKVVVSEGGVSRGVKRVKKEREREKDTTNTALFVANFFHKTA